MILEIATIEVKDGASTDFEAAVRAATPCFQRARGCKGLALRRSVEQPNRYFLVVTWETLEDHTVHFRNSPDFQEWRQLAGPFMAAPPSVEHNTLALTAF